MTHELKTWPEYYQQVKAGKKTFELRKNDRNYNVGDILILKEWEPKPTGYSTDELKGVYTGDETKVQVTYMFYGNVSGMGIMQGYCIMAIKPII